tara:strand:+ start:350 stop:1717 length:1368 start_codon:yes stop_codon:yes gene_type:complete
MSIILRLDKGSELTFAEVDGNFQSLFYSASLVGTDLSFYTYNNVLSQSFDLSNIPGFGGITVQDDGSTIINAATGLNFIGSGVVVTQNGNTADVTFTGGGDTYTLSAGAKSGTSVPLNLDAAAGSDSTVNLTEGTGITLTQTSATEITIDSAGGNFINANALPQNFPGNSPFDNISSGTTFPSPGKSFQEMMDLMLYPTLFPSLTNPSLQSVNLTPNGFQIIGKLLTAGNLTLSCTFNQGSINPQYTTATNKRSGLPNTYNYTSPASAFVTSVSTTALSNTVANTSTYTVTAGTNSFSVSVNYDIGPQPKNSVGGDFDNPLAAGFNPPGSTSRSITGVFPVFATTTNYNVTDQLSLQNMGNSDVIVDMILEDGTAGNKQAISIPNTAGGQSGFTAFTDVQQEDPLSPGSFVPITGGLTTFTLTTETRAIESVSRTYNLYTHNGGQIGARKLKFIN